MTDEDPPNPPYMIRVRNLYKAYGSQEVLKGLSLDVYSGETLVILGRSGVGKSVLLKQIIGIEIPDKGEVEVDGTVLNEKQLMKKARKSMGMLFQGAALFDSMTVGENTAFYLKQHESLSHSDLKNRVKEALHMVGLEDTEHKMPSELSGGMRKRAALSRLIVYRPRIILYDEPTTGLDPITAMQINELIKNTQKGLEATSIVVTHDLRSALEVGDRFAFHDEGKIVALTSKKDFFQTDNPLARSFIDNALLKDPGFNKDMAHG